MYICLVNLVPLHLPASGGVGQIARIVAKVLLDHAARDPHFLLIFAVNPVLRKEFIQWLGVDNVSAPYILTKMTMANAEASVGLLLNLMQPDLIISPVYGTMPFHPQVHVDKAIPHIAFMPDAQVLEHPEFFDAEQLQARRLIYAELARATHIVTLSDYSSEQLVQHLDLRSSAVTAIPLGSDRLTHITADENAFRPDAPYLLYPANTWKHKRHDLLLHTIEKIWLSRPEVHLVLTGGRHVGGDEALLDWIQSSAQATGKVHDLGYVSDAHLKALYQHAEAVVFPSVYEGFAMPLVEAMAFDCPVICTDTTCIPQTVGEAAIKLPETADASEWADAILNVLPVRRAEMIAAGRLQAQKFTWEQSIEAYRALLQKFGIQFEPAKPVVRSAPAYELLPVDAPQTHNPPQIKALRSLYEQYDNLRRASDAPRLSRIPVLGFFVRTWLRLRNSQQLDTARIDLLNALLEHQEQLATYIAEMDKGAD